MRSGWITASRSSVTVEGMTITKDASTANYDRQVEEGVAALVEDLSYFMPHTAGEMRGHVSACLRWPLLLCGGEATGWRRRDVSVCAERAKPEPTCLPLVEVIRRVARLNKRPNHFTVIDGTSTDFACDGTVSRTTMRRLDHHGGMHDYSEL